MRAKPDAGPETEGSRRLSSGISIRRSSGGTDDVSGRRSKLPPTSRCVARVALDQAGASGLAHRYGTALEDILNHSWRRIPSSEWIWIPKNVILGDLGFPARSHEIHRFGDLARRVKRSRDPPPLTRSFVEVVKGEEMEQGRGRYPRRFGGGGCNFGGKRSAPEEWMDSDDLLVEEDL